MIMLPKLTVSRIVQDTALQESLNAYQLEVWKENDGTICAYGYCQGDQYCMIMPGLASFVFHSNGEEVLAIPTAHAHQEQIEDTFYRNIIPMVLQVGGQEVLHASAVRMGSNVVGFCARSETGKSTIAFALGKRGYSQWADDTLAIDLSESTVKSIQLPYSIRLRPESAAFFAHTTTVLPCKQETILAHAPLMALCVLQRTALPNNIMVQIQRLSERESFPEVLSHAYCFSLRNIERKRTMMYQYLELVRRVPVFSVRFPGGLDSLPIILDAIEAAVDSIDTSIGTIL